MPPKNTQSSSKNPTSTVKVTHLRRSRKTSKEPSVDALAVPSSSTSVSRKPTSNTIESKVDSLFKTPENPPIRIVDFRTETSPKRLQNERSSASIVLLESASKSTRSVSSGASPNSKPLSNVSRASQFSANRSQTPVSETNHDNTSIADNIADSNSISVSRIKRTEVERKQYFENQSECGSIEAHRAFCTRCKEWVRLSSRQTYYVKPWEVHRGKCDQKLPVEYTYKDLGLVASIPFVVPRTEKIRKVLLELDDSAETVEPDQVKCKICEQWVPLEKKYCIKSWSRHRGACRSNVKPSDIEQALERKLFFMCDAQFKKISDKHTVECRACNEAVSLKPEADYDLDLWLEHKKTCYLPPEAQLRPLSTSGNQGNPSSTKPDQEARPQSSAKSTINSTQSERRTIEPTSTPSNSNTQLTRSAGPAILAEPATLSTTDSERTLVPLPSLASIPSSSSQVVPESTTLDSRKRPRDSNEDADADEEKEGDVDTDGERSTRRPRLASYIPEEGDDPAGLGWFLLPFQAFVKGFKESLTTPDP